MIDLHAWNLYIILINNVYKRHVGIDTGVKLSKLKIFSKCYFNGIKIVTAFKCIFEETRPKLSVNFGNIS